MSQKTKTWSFKLWELLFFKWKYQIYNIWCSVTEQLGNPDFPVYEQK